MKEASRFAAMFAALGHENRVQILQLLLAAHPHGMVVGEIQEELEIRKRVERAKEVLMRRRNMTGNEAFRWIQKRSMDSRKTMRDVAEAILLSEELE